MVMIEIPQSMTCIDLIKGMLLKGRMEKYFRFVKTVIGFMCFVDDDEYDTNLIASRISGVLVIIIYFLFTNSCQ